MSRAPCVRPVASCGELEFAGRAAAPSAVDAAADAGLEPSSTNIEAALDAALAAHGDGALAGAVVVSDGHENVGDAARALRAAREARLPLQWVAVSRPAPPTSVVQVLAPTRARVGQRVQVSVQLGGALDRPVRIEASARGPSGQTQTASTGVVDEGRATIVLEARHIGALLVDVTLRDPASGATIDASPDAAVIDVAPPAAILYAQGSSGSFSQSLLRGGWSLDVVPVTRLDAHADGLDAYQAVVLDDVAVSDAGPRFWDALAAAVRERGLGLLVLGGERSFARGGYRGSTLESLLPVASEPAALDQPASVVFAVDKSGSMGEGSGGVDRFQLAQRAVLETARGLGPRDSLGLLVFDVVPRVLIPLGPAADGMAVLARDWRASPNGGTRLGPALDAAISELERSGSGRRMLVVVTDGFTDDASIAELHARLARARVETIALAIGPDADVVALQRLFAAGEGQVLRVRETAELPRVMRSGLERRRRASRARRDRGRAAATAAVPPGNAHGLAGRRRARGDALAGGRRRRRAEPTRRAADRVPAIGPRPRRRRHLRIRRVDTRLAVVARVAAAGGWPGGLGERHVAGRRSRAHRVGPPRGTSGRGRSAFGR